MTNFRQFAIISECKESAIKKAENQTSMTIIKEAAGSFRKYKEELEESGLKLNEETINDFCIEYLQANKAKPGECFYITLVKAIKNTKTRPYSFENLPRDPALKFGACFKVTDADDNVLAIVTGTKKEAIAKAKELIVDYKEDLFIDIARHNIKGSAVNGVLHYVPSENTTDGTYLFFGIDK